MNNDLHILRNVENELYASWMNAKDNIGDATVVEINKTISRYEKDVFAAVLKFFPETGNILIAKFMRGMPANASVISDIGGVDDGLRRQNWRYHTRLHVLSFAHRFLELTEGQTEVMQGFCCFGIDFRSFLFPPGSEKNNTLPLTTKTVRAILLLAILFHDWDHTLGLRGGGDWDNVVRAALLFSEGCGFVNSTSGYKYALLGLSEDTFQKLAADLDLSLEDAGKLMIVVRDLILSTKFPYENKPATPAQALIRDMDCLTMASPSWFFQIYYGLYFELKATGVVSCIRDFAMKQMEFSAALVPHSEGRAAAYFRHDRRLASERAHMTSYLIQRQYRLLSGDLY